MENEATEVVTIDSTPNPYMDAMVKGMIGALAGYALVRTVEFVGEKVVARLKTRRAAKVLHIADSVE